MAGRLGAALLARIVRLYPREVRERVGPQLLDATLRRWDGARALGLRSRLRWWSSEGALLVWGVVAERWDRRSRRARSGSRRRGGRGWEGMMGDVRWLLREMGRNLGFSGALITVLALAIALATSVFAFRDGVQPLLGRTFTVEERGELVALLDHGFWQRHFGGDPEILGQTVRIAQQSWTAAS